MTTVLTRLYENEAYAKRVLGKLRVRRLPYDVVSIISQRPGEDKAGLEERMRVALVDDSATGAYAAKVAEGNSLLVVRAGSRPLGVAKIAREVLGGTNAIPMGNLAEEYFVRQAPRKARSVMMGSPRFLTSPPELRTGTPRTFSESAGWPLLIKRKESNSVMRGGRFMSRGFWPMALLSTKERPNRVYSGGRYMSRAFWPMSLLAGRSSRLSVLPEGSLPLSQLLGWNTISRR